MYAFVIATIYHHTITVLNDLIDNWISLSHALYSYVMHKALFVTLYVAYCTLYSE